MSLCALFSEVRTLGDAAFNTPKLECGTVTACDVPARDQYLTFEDNKIDLIWMNIKKKCLLPANTIITISLELVIV